MSYLEIFISILVSVAPALTAIIGIIAAVIKLRNSTKNVNKEMIDKFEEVRAEVANTKEYEELKQQYKVSLEQNNELIKKLNELLTKIDHISR